MENRKTIRTSKQKERFDSLKTEISNEIASLKGLNDVEKKNKNENIKAMIGHYIALTDKVEDRRNSLHTFTLQMMAVWVAAIFVLLALRFDDKITMNCILFGIILGVLVIQVLFNLFSAIFYEQQSSFRYPFLWPELEDYGNTWKWFYYANKPIQRIGTNPFHKLMSFEISVEPFLESYRDFVHAYETETIDLEISNNIQQLHLLRVHNYYKNKFYLQLTSIQKYSYYALLLSSILGLIIVLFWG